MEVAKMKNKDGEEEEEEVMLPGFRFHPTDDELVGFYLRRKVDKKPVRIQLIKQIDIYKYDPWDLPKVSTVGEKEWYFFCIRGRKYRNSIRPNRVTPSGFWKATGIDKPVHSHDSSIIIGLKKSLVYYRGSAGKGTKTDWMMHEFRLPPSTSTAAKNLAQEAEVWTLCRIFKRIPSYKKYTPPPPPTPNWEKTSAGDSSSKTCSLESEISSEQQYYMGFGDSRVAVQQNVERKPFINHNSHLFMSSHQLNSIAHQSPFTASFSNPNGEDDVFTNGSWDELRPVVELAIDPYHQVMKYGMNLLEEISDREDEEGIYIAVTEHYSSQLTSLHCFSTSGTRLAKKFN